MTVILKGKNRHITTEMIWVVLMKSLQKSAVIDDCLMLIYKSWVYCLVFYGLLWGEKLFVACQLIFDKHG